MKSGMKRSAAVAGLNKQESGSGGKKEYAPKESIPGMDVARTPDEKTDLMTGMGRGRGRGMRRGMGRGMGRGIGRGMRRGMGRGMGQGAGRGICQSIIISPIPKYYRRYVELRALRHTIAGKSIEVVNLPSMEEEKLSKNLLGLLSMHGKIVTHEFCTHHSLSKKKTKVFKVLFETYDAALASKKSIGTRLKNKFLNITHYEDRYMLKANRIVISHHKNRLTTDFIWKTFGDCGEIYSIGFTKKGECYLTFKTMNGKSEALSSLEEYKKKNLTVSDYVFNNSTECRRLYLENLSKHVSENDIEEFVAHVGKPKEIKLFTSGVACVEFMKQSNIAKALPLDGKMLKGNKVFVYVNEGAYSQFSESELCKQETDEEEKDDDNDDDDDREDEEDEDGEQEEDDDSDD